MPTRRRLLAAIGAAAVAGCASPDFDYSDEGAANERTPTSPAVGDATRTADGHGGTETGGENGGPTTAAGTGEPTTPGTDATPTRSTAFSSSAFEDGGSIPERFTADGVNVSPPLTVERLPDGTAVYALLLEDLDVEDPPFTHWLVWNVAPGIDEVPAGIPPEEEVASLGDARQGTNDFGTVGYRGPAPPASDPPHSYRLALLALEEGLSLPGGADRAAFDEAVADVVVGRDEIVASYVR